MGVAAKSNVEKRQVGCVIVNITSIYDKEVLAKIVGEGYNDEGYHAEHNACEDMCARGEIPQDANLKAYVTHQPCPECSKMLIAHGVTEVEIVESFMKFDGDKLRFDLIDCNFMLKLIGNPLEYNHTYDSIKTKINLYRYGAAPKPQVGALNHLNGTIGYVVESYGNLECAEEALARVLTFGARKYKPNNWRKCKDTGRYLAAAHRHNNAIIAGEQCDEDSGFDHRDHLLTNLMFLHVLGLNIGED